MKIKENDVRNEVDELRPSRTVMFLWERAIIERKPNSKIVFGCLMLTASRVTGFDLFYTPYRTCKESKLIYSKLFISVIGLSHIFRHFGQQ